MALFPEWLAPVPGLPTRALCQLCSKEMNAELTQLKRHEVNKINAFESNKYHYFFIIRAIINI